MVVVSFNLGSHDGTLLRSIKLLRMISIAGRASTSPIVVLIAEITANPKNAMVDRILKIYLRMVTTFIFFIFFFLLTDCIIHVIFSLSFSATVSLKSFILFAFNISSTRVNEATRSVQFSSDSFPENEVLTNVKSFSRSFFVIY